MKYIPIQETQLAAMGAALVVGVGFAVLPLDAQTVLPGHSQAFHGVHKIGATPVHSPRPRTAENQFPYSAERVPGRTSDVQACPIASRSI